MPENDDIFKNMVIKRQSMTEIIKNKTPLMRMNEDQTAFVLALPLGTPVFRANTQCMDTCYRDLTTGEITSGSRNYLSKDSKKDLNIWYSASAACHVLFTGLTEEKLSLANLWEISTGWLTTWFPTANSAREYAKDKVLENRRILDEKGIPYGKDESRIKELDFIYDVGR